MDTRIWRIYSISTGYNGFVDRECGECSHFPFDRVPSRVSTVFVTLVGFRRTNGFAKHRISVAIKRTHTQRKSNEDKRNCLAGKTVVNFLWCKRQEYSHQFVGTEKQKKASSCQENISKRFRLFNKNRKNESESETRWMLTNSKHACPTTPYT